MPRSARAFVPVDHVLPVRGIGALVVSLTKEDTVPAVQIEGPHVKAMEPDLGPPNIAVEAADRPGKVSVFTCPECHGTLWEADERGIVRFRCRVGHVYSPESMLAAQTDSVDRALWIALRSLEERAALTHRLSERARSRRHLWVSKAFEERALAADQHAAVIRDLLTNRMSMHEVPDSAPDPVPENVAPDVQKS
jgi:two-component system chemotaxis response regulator CheB